MLFDFVTSDTHYGHARIIELCNRPFENVDAMTEGLIERYNHVVHQDHTVLFCGDIFFCNVEKAKTIMSRLNGRKLLVRGNHDRGEASMATLGFELVANELVTNIAGRTVRISHYPYAGNEMGDGEKEQRYLDRRPERIKGEVLIHGHTHASTKLIGTQLHVGVDAWEQKPVSFDEVRSLIETI